MAADRRVFLVGDVGATNARLAIAARSEGRIEWLDEARRADSDFPSLDAAIDALFAQASVARDSLDAACFGIAGPIEGRRARFTNRDWVIDADALAANLGVPVALVNDLEAAARGIDGLPRDDFAMLQAGSTSADGVRLVIGAGTGLGVAYAVPCGGGYRIVASEGGHAGFAPQNARQRRLFDALIVRGERVDAEYVVSGAGLERVYAALAAEHPEGETAALRAELQHGLRASTISRFALDGADPLAAEALDLFIDCYGSVAGDHALAVLPRGGVYIVGGIAAKILPRLAAGGFVRAFVDKAEFATLARSFQIAVVTNERLGLVGATLIAGEFLAESRRPR